MEQWWWELFNWFLQETLRLLCQKGERGQLEAQHKQEEGELLTKQVKVQIDKNGEKTGQK